MTHSSPMRNAPFRQNKRMGERWLAECQRRNEIDIAEPTLFHAYICDGGPVVETARCRGISEFFEGPWANDPNLAQARNALAKLWAIAVKAHFFLFRMDYLREEPSVFWIPDLLRQAQNRFGIYCPFLHSGKALVTAEADMALVSSGRLALGKFPVVLTSDASGWYDEKHWIELAKMGDAMKLAKDASLPAEAKGAREHQDPFTFPYGTLFDVPADLRPQMRSAGLKWAEGVGKMYLPKGFDVPPVEAYHKHLMRKWHEAKALAGA